jgi:hypothetical protein
MEGKEEFCVFHFLPQRNLSCVKSENHAKLTCQNLWNLDKWLEVRRSQLREVFPVYESLASLDELSPPLMMTKTLFYGSFKTHQMAAATTIH